jgi:hypothetical protein
VFEWSKEKGAMFWWERFGGWNFMVVAQVSLSKFDNIQNNYVEF